MAVNIRTLTRVSVPGGIGNQGVSANGVACKLAESYLGDSIRVRANMVRVFEVFAYVYVTFGASDLRRITESGIRGEVYVVCPNGKVCI